jgi:hypothetical protein
MNNAEGLRPSARPMRGTDEVRLRWIIAPGWRQRMAHVVRWLRRHSGRLARDGVWLLLLETDSVLIRANFFSFIQAEGT